MRVIASYNFPHDNAEEVPFVTYTWPCSRNRVTEMPIAPAEAISELQSLPSEALRTDVKVLMTPFAVEMTVPTLPTYSHSGTAELMEELDLVREFSRSKSLNRAQSLERVETRVRDCNDSTQVLYCKFKAYVQLNLRDRTLVSKPVIDSDKKRPPVERFKIKVSHVVGCTFYVDHDDRMLLADFDKLESQTAMKKKRDIPEIVIERTTASRVGRHNGTLFVSVTDHPVPVLITPEKPELCTALLNVLTSAELAA
eukprot:GHVU01209310.1.p1 GENE.GHVU01209310.1~~GHVU01209310.1.p1  ORF type:complete len:254 (+),score=29.27 GHVU01209310.1:761-1522(+)